MGVEQILKRKTGVIVGEDVHNLFTYAKEHKFAIPAINVTSSSTAVAALEAARDSKSPIILQTSNGGAAYFAGKGISNEGQNASIKGAIAAAHYIKLMKLTSRNTVNHYSPPTCWICLKKPMKKTSLLVSSTSREWPLWTNG